MNSDDVQMSVLSLMVDVVNNFPSGLKIFVVQLSDDWWGMKGLYLIFIDSASQYYEPEIIIIACRIQAP